MPPSAAAPPSTSWPYRRHDHWWSYSPRNPSPEPSQGPSDQGLAAFLEKCARTITAWQPGQATYPQNLTVDLGGSTTYQAQVDISPGAQQQLPPAGDTAANVQVSCGLGARLEAVGDSVTVNQSDWTLEQFAQPGIAQWSWTVKAVKPGDAQVRLDLRPAVAVKDGGYVVPAENSVTNTLHFTSAVQVHMTWTQGFYAWWDANWSKLTAIVAGIGAAIAAVLAWLRKQRGESRRRGRTTGRRTPAAPSRAAARRTPAVPSPRTAQETEPTDPEAAGTGKENAADDP